MKYSRSMLTLLLILTITSTSIAKIWYVDNNTGNSADFTKISDAITAAAAGDTIYVAGSSINYSSLTLTKKLVLIGPGYFLGENPKSQVLPLSAKITGATFDSGSEGSIVSGFESSGKFSVNVNNITLKNNYIHLTRTTINISSNVANTIVSNNYLSISSDGVGSSCILIHNYTSNIIISNNYMENIPHGTSTYVISSSSSSSIIQNNVLNGSIYGGGSLIQNNILIGGSLTETTASTIKNNMSNQSQFGTSNGNLENVDMATIFLGVEGNSTDGQWQLKSGTAAIGAGANGEDLGMFGGSSPYVLSGLPPIPHIYFYSAPISGSGKSGLAIKLKAKSGGN